MAWGHNRFLSECKVSVFITLDIVNYDLPVFFSLLGHLRTATCNATAFILVRLVPIRCSKRLWKALKVHDGTLYLNVHVKAIECLIYYVV